MEDRTIVEQKSIIFLNINLQIIFPMIFFVGYHEHKLRVFLCTYNEQHSFSMEIYLVVMEKVFQSGGIKIILIK